MLRGRIVAAKGIRAEDLVPVAAGGGPPFDIAVVEPLAASVRSGP